MGKGRFPWVPPGSDALAAIVHRREPLPQSRPRERGPMNDAPVTRAVEEGVAWITLNRPAVLNALNTDLAAALADHAEAAATDPTVTLVVVRGAGRAFSSGMDRTALAAGAIGEAFYPHRIRAPECPPDKPKNPPPGPHR